MNGLVFAAIAPHGHLAIPEACAPHEHNLAVQTREGMRELERRFHAARPQSVVVLTPHNVHVEGAMAVVVSAAMVGELEEAAQPIRLESRVDRQLAQTVLDAIKWTGIPAVSISYGGNDPEDTAMPLDWGVLVPLWYMGGRLEPPVPVVVVSPARDLSPEHHVQAGRGIAEALAASDKRVALVASADHAHTHRADGRYGYHPSAKPLDDLIVAAVAENDLGRLLAVDPQLIEDARPDSWWQLLMLHGALGNEWEGELLSYEAPTYYGMLCAAYRPR
jgi:aromatic ring-opening dioxygenase LigB subunit